MILVMSSIDSHQDKTSVVVVASVDKCLGPCDRGVGFYVDSLTGRQYRIDCACQCKHRYHKESDA